jgi:hypothetical protein
MDLRKPEPMRIATKSGFAVRAKMKKGGPFGAAPCKDVRKFRYVLAAAVPLRWTAL